MPNQSGASSERIRIPFYLIFNSPTIYASIVFISIGFVVYFVFHLEVKQNTLSYVDSRNVSMILSPDSISSNGTRMFNPSPAYSAQLVKVQKVMEGDDVLASHGFITDLRGASQFIYSPVVMYNNSFGQIPLGGDNQLVDQLKLAVVKDCQVRRGCEGNPVEMNRRLQELKKGAGAK